MADTLFTRALTRAAEIQGSTQALASLLRVPENTLLRWMAGRAQMPLQAFLKTIELVAAEERKETPPPRTAGTPAEEKLRFKIGDLEARCTRCDGHDFIQTDPSLPLRYINELLCSACGERVIHGDLIAQLAKDAVHHSKALTVQRQKRSAELLKSTPKLRMLRGGAAPEPQAVPTETAADKKTG